MTSRYEIGQKVTIKTVDGQNLSPRDCAIDKYAGQIGEITDYYSISPRGTETFYIYLVQVETDYKEIALHEDELEAYIE
ncbi:hypothetical protein ACFLUZ_04380 [Chloroflexota bacterium]